MQIKSYKRIYHVTVVKYIQSTASNIILATQIFNNIKEAKLYAVNIISNFISKDLNITTELLPIEIDQYANQYIKQGIEYGFFIQTNSFEKRIFENSNELMNYLNNNINKIPNEQLFDFLLSLVSCRNDWFDHIGRYIHGEIIKQPFINQSIFSADIDFNETDCLKGIYTFKYY